MHFLFWLLLTNKGLLLKANNGYGGGGGQGHTDIAL